MTATSSTTVTPGTLYLIPVPLGPGEASDVIPQRAAKILDQISIILAEDERSARRAIRLMAPDVPVAKFKIERLNEHTQPHEIKGLLQPLVSGESVGVISEAGCPGVADPGALVVREAHRIGARVVPLVGPSSILLALMASGLNGQRFSFVGYLPKEKGLRCQEIVKLEKKVQESKESQIFIETPYRNLALFQDLLLSCRAETSLCVACAINTADEYIETHPISEWRKRSFEIPKEPCTFILGV